MQLANILFGSGDVWANLLGERQRIAASRLAVARPTANIVNDQIAMAPRLDRNAKQTLRQLTGTVSRFAGGDPTLMRSIIGIANIMQIGAEEQRYDIASAAYTKIVESHYQARLPGTRLTTEA